MKVLKIIGIVLGALFAILVIAIVMQPEQAHIEKSVLIRAPASKIFPQVSNYQNFSRWSPWTKMDPEVKQTFEGAEGTVGSKMNWDGPKTGTGSQQIEEIEENKRVKSVMTFGGMPGKFYNQFILEPEGENTRVTWTYDGPNDGISGKAIWIVMGSILNAQYNQGLADLKTLVESNNVE